jgi:hypothetical protein
MIAAANSETGRSCSRALSAHGDSCKDLTESSDSLTNDSGRIDQDPADEVERLLRSGRHEHVLPTNAETVMRSPIRDRLPKRGYAISRAVLQRARSMSPQDSLAGVAEFIEGTALLRACPRRKR